MGNLSRLVRHVGSFKGLSLVALFPLALSASTSAQPVAASGMSGIDASAAYFLGQGLGNGGDLPSNRTITPRDVTIESLREGAATLSDVNSFVADGGRRILSLSVGAIDFRRGRPVLRGGQVTVIWKGSRDKEQTPFLSLNSGTVLVPFIVNTGPTIGNACRGKKKAAADGESEQRRLALELVKDRDGRSYIYASGTQHVSLSFGGNVMSQSVKMSGDLRNVTLDITGVNDPQRKDSQGLVYHISFKNGYPVSGLYATFGEGQKELKFNGCGELIVDKKLKGATAGRVTWQS
jgi:hypothetical protein